MTTHPGPMMAERPALMPSPLDSETVMLLRTVLLPHFERATSWDDLRCRLNSKGYEITFRCGHLVLADESGRPICTGSMIGTPLSRLAKRLGRPTLCSDCSGASATLKH